MWSCQYPSTVLQSGLQHLLCWELWKAKAVSLILCTFCLPRVLKKKTKSAKEESQRQAQTVASDDAATAAMQQRILELERVVAHYQASSTVVAPQPTSTTTAAQKCIQLPAWGQFPGQGAAVSPVNKSGQTLDISASDNSGAETTASLKPDAAVSGRISPNSATKGALAFSTQSDSSTTAASDIPSTPALYTTDTSAPVMQQGKHSTNEARKGMQTSVRRDDSPFTVHGLYSPVMYAAPSASAPPRSSPLGYYNLGENSAFKPITSNVAAAVGSTEEGPVHTDEACAASCISTAGRQSASNPATQSSHLLTGPISINANSTVNRRVSKDAGAVASLDASAAANPMTYENGGIVDVEVCRKVPAVSSVCCSNEVIPSSIHTAKVCLDPVDTRSLQQGQQQLAQQLQLLQQQQLQQQQQLEQQQLQQQLQAEQVQAYRREASHSGMLLKLLQQDYQDLEFVLKETEKQRREYAARYAFVVLDQDHDGYIPADQIDAYELFAPYSPEVLKWAFRLWRWQSGFPGFLNIEDFVK